MNLSISTYCPTATNTVPIGVDFLFTFTGKERDEETCYTYHGARYYDADLLTSWMAVDPMSDKYPSLSPYNYCAWNPVKLVDPDGREIHISILVNNQKTDYYYHYDFQSKKTTWTDKGGNVLDLSSGISDTDKEFVSKLTSALESLTEKAVGGWLVGKLMEDEKHDVEIRSDYYNWSSAGTEVGFLAEERESTNGCIENPIFIGLGHELAHIYDAWYGDYGTTSQQQWFSYPPSEKVRGRQWTSRADIWACKVENWIRYEHNLDQREYYYHGENTNLGPCIMVDNNWNEVLNYISCH